MAQQTISPDQVKDSHGHLKHTPSLGQQKPNIPAYYDSQRPKDMPQLTPDVTNNTGIPPIGTMGGKNNHQNWTPTLPGMGGDTSRRGGEHHDTGPELPGTENHNGDNHSESGWDYREHGEPDIPEPQEHEKPQEDHSGVNNKPPSDSSAGTTSTSGGKDNTTSNTKSDQDSGKVTTPDHQNSDNENTKEHDSGEPPQNDDKMVTPDYDPAQPAHSGQRYGKPGNGQPAGDPDDTQTTGTGQPNPSVMLHNPNQVRPNGDGSSAGGRNGSRLPRVNGAYDPADGSIAPGTGTAQPTNIPEHPGTEGR